MGNGYNVSINGGKMMANNDFISSFMNGQPLSPFGSNLAIAEWIAEGTPDGTTPERIAPLHKHNNDDEAWYILEGSLAFQIGDQILEANVGQAVIVPGGTPHTFWNPGSKQARYLIIMTRRIVSLIDAIHNTSPRDMEEMKNLFKKYDSEIL